MKKRIVKFIFGALAISLMVASCQMVRNSGDMSLPAAMANTFRMATYNVHYININKKTGPWSLGDWERRKGPLDMAIKEISADVIAFQEMESFAGNDVSTANLTLDWLLEQNTGYGAAAVGDPTEFPSTQPILFRRERVEMLDHGWFFFSETPDVIYSQTFNGSYPAFASWAAFRGIENDDEFRVVNIHTDFASRTNKLRSIELVAERIAPWAASGETVFVVGDLNARLGDKAMGILEDAGVKFARTKGTTYHLNRGLNLFGAIDHIGILGKVDIVGEPVVLRRQFDGEWPTDHYPVIVDFKH